MWTFVQTSYQLAMSCFVGLPGASALVILVKAIELVAEHWLGTDTGAEDITGADEITSFVENLIEAIVLSPYAILIQRRIILHEVSSNYLTAATSLRFVRFVGAAQFLVFANALAYHALGLSQSSNWSMLVAMICVVAFVILFLRIFLAFPAIATDGSSTPFSDSFRDTRGSSWWLFFLFMLMVIPIGLLEIGLEQSLGNTSEYASMWWLGVSAMTLLRAFSFAVIVTSASYLYATRSGWRMISPAVPVSAPAARTRLIFCVIAILAVVPAAYYINYWVPLSLLLFFFIGLGSGFSAYIALQILALFTLRKPLWFWALVPLPFMLAVAFVTEEAFRHQSNIWPILMIFASPLAVLWLAIIEVFGLWGQAHPRRRALTLLTIGIVFAPILLTMLGLR